MIGNSQLLNLPVSEVIVINQFNNYYIVPQGKVAQLVSSSCKNYSDSYNHTYVSPRLDDECIDLVFGNNSWWDKSTIYGNTVLPAGTTVSMAANSSCWNGAYSFVIFDLNAQNLASNVPKQTTPTLYPNPTSSLLALNSDKEYDIEVYDMAGNKVMALTGNTIDMSHLSSATYIVKALDKVDNEEVSYKVVKN